MNIEQLNQYLKNYLENDKTNSAIMLTGAWGTGKSHYIKNQLISFLDEANEGKCVIVSLYGIKDLKEISKSIYLEVRAKKIKETSEGATAGKLVAKTVFKGVTSFFGVDLKADEEALQALYESIDLSGKLIILEDLERCSIDIIELLGFVNNLVEQDEVKVLLVANEKELIKSKTQNILVDERSSESDEKKQRDIKITEATSQEYKKIKEKTVSDTIIFYSPYIEAINNIIRGFDNKYLNNLLNEKNEYGEPLIVHEIENNIMSHKGIDNHNLRSFIFACQKTVDMFHFVDESYSQDFLKHIFLSNVAFCLRLKANENLRWEDKNKDYYSNVLATTKYPLYRISYDFIMHQYIDSKELKEYNDVYVRTQKYERDIEKLGQDLRCIYAFYVSKEADVIVAINNVYKQLEENTIPLTEYGKLANYLIAIKSIIGQEEKIEGCKKIMLNNLSGDDSKVEDRITIHDSFALEGEYAEELSLFEKEMLQKVKKTYSDAFDFNYTTEKVGEFCHYVYDNRDKFVSRGAFAVKINADEFVRLLGNCSAEQMSDLRDAFHVVYTFSNIDDYFIGDQEALIEIKDKVEELRSSDNAFDKIQLMQLEYFCSSLQRIITKLNSH